MSGFWNEGNKICFETKNSDEKNRVEAAQRTGHMAPTDRACLVWGPLEYQFKKLMTFYTYFGTFLSLYAFVIIVSVWK